MNQILWTEGYKFIEEEEEEPITQKVNKKNKYSNTSWKISLKRIEMKTLVSFIMVFCICLLFSYCIYAYEVIAKNDEQVIDIAEVQSEPEVVEQEAIVEEEEPQTIVATELIGLENTVYTSNSGEEYTIVAILNIPSLGIKYPVLSENSDELMEISLNKYWGAEPNEVRKLCYSRP